MLLQKQKELPYTHVFKLTSGEELIAKIIDDDPINYTIEKPLQMAMGQRGLQFAPFMMMSDQDKSLKLRKDKIVADSSPSSGIESQYEQITSGIVLPQKSPIIS